ncbi:MAG: 2OG-Fe(II) oxygenase [Xanthomonadales bacterium]|nr:2OG-Fe(II) oxygenase [Xanthomonadales bacterium]
MISNEIDIDHWRRALAERSRIQIPDFLQPAAAEAFARELAERVPWQLAERSDGESRLSPRGAYPDDAEYARLLQRGYARATDTYQFAYDSYMLVKAAKEAWDPTLLVHGILQFLNTPPFIEFARYLGNDASITHVGAQCTRYRPGHYLMPHEDLDEGEGRRYAMVINLSREWRPDWGGQLQFLDSDGGVIETFLPRWNSLSLFRVPQRHQVTLVTPWAARPRHAITGWWLAR